MKVVFDTNVLVSALVFPGGRGEEALLRIVHERDELVVSKSILECALAGQAEVIVTGDKALLALGEYRGIRIITLRDYLESDD